ncbi:uncharacterized protein LOC128222513 isoform X1 [Mya arenaria]|uniref:uncharacterized protein LOC128222513 isoform X1 n=1 Tax=Mya arenaria TaxID=6604 RepID=UPI0022E2F084|nr:uncharacterized protein LOC128222513 isoform X1 [Mya arenaria]
MYKQIQKYHDRNYPLWMNTDSTKWQDQHVGYWVAKCYLSSVGYFDKTGPNHVDASGLLSICINSSFIKQRITTIKHFKEVRDIRNKTLHDAHYEMDGKTADDCLNKMIKVLEDRKELKYDNYAKQAAFHIRKIKIKAENTPTIMTEALHKWLQINVDVDKSLKEIECLMYDRLQKDLKGFIVAEVKRVVKHSLDDRGNDENEQKVEGLCHQLVKYYQQQLNSTPISPLLSDKDENLDKLYIPPKIVEKDPRKVGTAAKEKGTTVTTYRQIFSNAGEFMKHVLIVGEAGMGKSSCAAMCALKWANQFSSTKTSNNADENASLQKPFPEEKQNYQFQDDSFYKEIDFLFHLRLRDSGELCHMTDMIRDQLISRIYQKDEIADAYSTMMHVLSNYKCVIIADGLDEWSHPDGTNCNCTSEDKVIPYLAPTIDAIVLITSRPWRMSQQRVQDTKINKYLELEGTADIMLLIQKLLNSLNETVSEKKTLEDFVKSVDIMKLKCLLSVPIVSMLLVCLWFQGMPESSSMCDIYALFIEMMFAQKHRHVSVVPQTKTQLPRCFKKTTCIHNNYNILKNMAELAFTKLFLNDRTSFLVFKEVDILAQDNLVFLLKSGVLQETKSASLIRNKSSYSFIHKTVQEFLATIHMYYHPDDLHRVLTPFYEKNGEMSDISHVHCIVFMCGLNIELANEMCYDIEQYISRQSAFCDLN